MEDIIENIIENKFVIIGIVLLTLFFFGLGYILYNLNMNILSNAGSILKNQTLILDNIDYIDAIINVI